jgi:hypothetical protein
VEDGIQEGIVEPLAKNCSYTEGKGVVVECIESLVHLSSHGTSANPVCRRLLMEPPGMNRMIEIVLSRPEMSRVKTGNIGGRNVFAMLLLANMRHGIGS